MSSFVETIKKAGVIGAGGAGFPTHVKLDAKAEYVIVNGAECEPLLRVDQQLLSVYPDEILDALNQVVREVEAKKGILALKKKYHLAIENLTERIKKYEGLEIFLLDDFYPAGDEQATVYEVLKRIVPEGGIPIEVGAVVLNAETLLNIHHAVSDIPVTEKYVTVAGAVRRPVTLKVPVGTDFETLIQAAGGPMEKDYAIINGGPMMGKLLEGEGFVKKNTKGIILLPKDHYLVQAKKKPIEAMIRESRIACCQCSLCTEVCPRNLLGHRLNPHKLMRITGYNGVCDASASAQEAFLCCECGLCEQACVMGLQPWKLNQMLKGKLAAAGIKNPYRNRPEEASPFREYRKFPVKRLIQRLGLEQYNVDAPLDETFKLEIKEVKIEFRQHIGAPAEPVAAVGDRVAAKQVIAGTPDGKMGILIHSSIDGIVTSVSEEAVVISAGREV